MKRLIRSLRHVVAASLLVPALSANAAPIFFGPTSYFSTADIPAGFYASGSPTYLADMEANFPRNGFGLTDYLNGDALSGGLFSGGLRSGCFATNTNGCAGVSVDADDGAIDGLPFGYALSNAGVSFVEVRSGPLPTAFAMVLTGGNPFATFRFKAFDALNQFLGEVTYPGLSVSFTNVPTKTAGHRFVGVQYDQGIFRVEVDAATSIAFDHVQYGAMPTAALPPATVPEPETLTLSLAALGLMGLVKRSRRSV